MDFAAAMAVTISTFERFRITYIAKFHNQSSDLKSVAGKLHGALLGKSHMEESKVLIIIQQLVSDMEGDL